MAAKFAWYDVTAKNTDKVRAFYSELFGWAIGPETNAGPYKGWIMDGDQPWAAVVEADDASAGHWLPYVQIDDLEAATAKATHLGATVVRGRTEGPAGAAVTIADPGGARVALWVPRAN